MELLATEKDDVRLKCEHCGAHRILSASVYRRAMRGGVGVRCATCTQVTDAAEENGTPAPMTDITVRRLSPPESSDLAAAG